MFITFEGIDFCGKSTQVELLKNFLLQKGKKVIVIREPGGTKISERIREILLDKKNEEMQFETEFLLFSASRSQLVREVIAPNLEKGFVVISDRFHDSSTAYQGYGRGLDIQKIKVINSFAIGRFVPNLTFLIDIPVEESIKRKLLKSNDELDRIEISSKKFFNNVRNGYLEIAKEESRFTIIDGTQSIEKIHNQIIDKIILMKGLIDEK
ncbi:MAG: dTMP kinase [Ignavibacterium sp.]|nr:dTMP kinase [Ignavibacterium sp.]MDW8374780.1 dTMP kinase [Ignavibacteriales bacterium]